MISLKLPQGTPIHRAIAGMVMGLLGVLWLVLVAEFAVNLSWPVVATLCGIGALWTVWYWGQAATVLSRAASQQQFAADDIDDVPARRCAACCSELEFSFRYCPQCGQKI